MHINATGLEGLSVTVNTDFRTNEPVSHINNACFLSARNVKYDSKPLLREKKTEKNIRHFKVRHCGEF